MDKLYTEIMSDPRAIDPYLVLADYLTEQDDPWAQLIQVGAGLLGKPDKAAAKKHEALEAELAPHLWADLAPFVKEGLICDLEWHCGFVKSAKIRNDWERYDSGDEFDIADMLDRLLARPVMRFVRDLLLGILAFEENSYHDACNVVGKHKLPTLESLYIGDFHREETELNWSDTGDISGAYAACPNLQHLTVRSGRMTLGKINLPELRSFTTITGCFRENNVKEVNAAHWPKLEKLVLEFGGRWEQAVTTVDPLAPILAGKNLEMVTHLGLTNFQNTDALCEALDGAAILKQLKVLDLSRGTLTDRGCQALANIKDQLAHLEHLILGSQNEEGDEESGNELTDAGVKLVRKLCERVTLPEADGYYPEVE